MRPLVAADTAKGITWGGAAACEACNLARRNLAVEGVDLGEGVCYLRYAAACEKGDEGVDLADLTCMHPAPPAHRGNLGLLDVWRDTEHAVTAGWDGVPTGRDLQQVETVARAHGEPFDPVFLKRFGVLVKAEKIQARKRNPPKK